MTIHIINPNNGKPLKEIEGFLIDSENNKFPIISNIPRIAALDNYTTNFGFQWNKFSKTQLDIVDRGIEESKDRLFAETHWNKEDLAGKSILEVGSGAGRFSKVILDHTKATLYSVDYSNAVTANYENNAKISPARFKLYQASIYELPFQNNSFDKVFCFGVLQHTPSFELSIKSLIDKAISGGEIVVDFYPIKGWWTKISAKYILRPLTKKMDNEKLLQLIESNAKWLIKVYKILDNIGLGILKRFLPICEVNCFPKELTYDELVESVILDTFDQYSPEYDNPQRINNVVKMFEKYGATVTFAGFEKFGKNNGSAAIVRGIKK